MPSSRPLPSLFISHGAPDILNSAPKSVEAMRCLAHEFPRPKSILVVSAHWMENPVGVTGCGSLETIHDFSGFSPELHARQYTAHGDGDTVSAIRKLLESRGIELQVHEQRGIDHGAWIPLSIIYPDADIPVVQLSLPVGVFADVAKIGKAIAPLRDEDVLIVGSGGSVHNLRRLKPSGPPDSWALGFEQWLQETIECNHFQRIIEPGRFTTYYAIAHPTPEHLAPLVLAWAAGDATRPGKRLHEGFSYGNLGMSNYLFGFTPAESIA